jgi:hypothetical protein
MSACSSADEAASPVTAPVATDVPTTVGPVSKESLPPSLRGVSGLAGGDPAEAACIDAGIVAALGADADPEAHAGIAGTAVVQCVAPAKLAAALAERLGSPALGLALDGDRLACARATFVRSAADPVFTVLVGGLALEDVAVVRQGAVPLDAACGTALAPVGD